MTSGPGRRILVVEDDPEISYLLHAVLSAEGHEVVCSETGAAARAEVEGGTVDLILLDLILPDVDGRSLLSHLRERPDTAAVPIVVVTARVGTDTRQECYALGADGFVEKPFDPDELVADVGVRLQRAAQAQKAVLSDALTGLPNMAGLRALCDECAGKYALGLLEIDSFDVRSDRWGWEGTEAVVRAVANALRRAVGGQCEIARLGGGDFALVLPNGDLTAVSAVAQQAIDAVKGIDIGSTLEGEEGLTATIGVVVGEPGDALVDSLDVARRRIFQTREAPGDQVASQDPGEGVRTARVVVAEDDEVSATILVHRLGKEGLDVVRFDNGQQALESALRDRPDLVILDVKMPGLDGFEVLDRLRRNPDFRATPIIMLTSMGQEADVVRGFRLGADDYILKPFSPTELSARVRRLLKRGRSPMAI